MEYGVLVPKQDPPKGVLADNGNKRAALALKLSEDYDKLISTILIDNNIVNIMVASIGTLLFVELYGDIGATVSTVVVTIVVLIVGVLHQKDFYINGKMTDQPISEIMTEPLFVYQHTKIQDILKMLQHQKSHVAVVVDDFGGTLGIVTMEDILDELVGEIWDEHDEVEEDFEKLDENTYCVDCSASLEDFMEFFDVKLESGSVSIGGWVMEQLNRFPRELLLYESLLHHYV